MGQPTSAWFLQGTKVGGRTLSCPRGTQSAQQEVCDKVGKEKPGHAPTEPAYIGTHWEVGAPGPCKWKPEQQQKWGAWTLAGVLHQSFDQSTTANLRTSPAETAPPPAAPTEPGGSHFLNHTN